MTSDHPWEFRRRSRWFPTLSTTSSARRGFLLGTSGLLAGATLAACAPDVPWPPDPGPPGAPGLPVPPGAADNVLAVPGSAGLIDEAVYQQRVEEFLAHATSQLQHTNPNNVAAHLIRAHRDPGFVWPIDTVGVGSFANEFDKIDEWKDTRDFDLMYFIWLLALGRGSTPMTQLDPELLVAIENRLLANRYRYDDPLPGRRLDNLWFWSENHLIINYAIEYLAGIHMPERTFAVTGLTGAEHAQRARPEILEWIRERAEFGFFEWHSHVYMLKNIAPLTMLVELSPDPEITAAAAVGLDMCLLDMAGHNHEGTYTAPRGRTYKKDKMSSLDEDTFDTAKFLFDDTTAGYQSRSNSGPIHLSAATRYRPPQLVLDMATGGGEHVVRERHGVHFDTSSPLVDAPEAPYGRDFNDKANLPFWWSLGALGMWPLTRVGVEAANTYRLWETQLFTEMNLIAMLNGYDASKLAGWLYPRSAAINFGFLSEANTYTYRHPKVSLASVQDHRAGEMRDQAHAWQAAIDENAMVFTNHPVKDVEESTNWNDDGRPGYWTGEASMPRSAQFERTAVHLYDPAWGEETDPVVWLIYGYRPFTHAYVPQDHFDEVRQVGHWTIAAKDGAYIALWSWRAPSWRVHDPAVVATRGMVEPFDLVAEGGPDNVWLVEVGVDDEHGDLDSFVAAVTAQTPDVTRSTNGFEVSWTSPSCGEIEFSSTGAFVVNGAEQPLGNFPRHESPWGTVGHLDTTYELHSGDASWRVDAEDFTRTVS